MRGASILKALTPAGWTVLAGGLVGGVAALLIGLGFRWDPLGLQQRRLAAAEARAEAGEWEAMARRLETEGGAEQQRRLESFHHQQTAAAQVTATAVAQARSADDADMFLEKRRADRLRSHDSELCRLAPELDGCAGAVVSAGGGESSVRPGDPAA